MRSTLVAVLLALSLTLPTLAEASDWTIDGAHSAVDFKVRHMMVSWVRGSFDKVSGTVHLDGNKLEATTAQVSIDAASIDTGNDKRDKHLRNDDFFAVDKHPAITFKSTSVRKVGEDSLELVGDLTLLETTREVVLAVTDIARPVKSPWGGMKSGASATLEIKRSDFGMTYSKVLETGGLVVGDVVKLTIDVELNAVKATGE